MFFSNQMNNVNDVISNPIKNSAWWQHDFPIHGYTDTSNSFLDFATFRVLDSLIYTFKSLKYQFFGRNRIIQ